MFQRKPQRARFPLNLMLGRVISGYFKVEGLNQKGGLGMQDIKVDAELVAYCGLYCGACRSYLKGK